MKAVRILISLSLLLPLAFVIAGFFDENYFITALVSTMGTGALQVIAGAIYWIVNKNSLDIRLYFSGVIGFFLLAFTVGEHRILFFIPPALCLFLCWIVFSHKPGSQKGYT